MMGNKYFVVQIKKTNTGSGFVNTVHTKETLADALHQFHAFMSTYGYGQDATVDYCACYVLDQNGTTYEWKVDDRVPAPQSEPNVVEETGE